MFSNQLAHSDKRCKQQDVLVSTRTGSESLCPVARSRRIPILASTSTLPLGISGRVMIIWCTKSAISLMNSSNGSTPRIESDRGGSWPEAEPIDDLRACPLGPSRCGGDGSRLTRFMGGDDDEDVCMWLTRSVRE